MERTENRAHNRSMKRVAFRAGIVGSFLAFRFAMGVVPSFAQVPPIPPLPQPTVPAPAQPALEILGPTIYPQCGTATLVLFEAASTAQGLPNSLDSGLKQVTDKAGLPPLKPLPNPGLGSYVYGATAPIFAICGQVPRPQTQLTCLLDSQAQDVINAGGVPLPLGLHPEGDVVEQTVTIEDRLPPPLNQQGLGSNAKVVLGCVETSAVPISRGDYEVPPPYTPPASGGFTYPPSIPASNPGIYTPPPVTTPSVPPSLAQSPPPTPAGEAVRYAAVWLLPLGLLLFGGYFGGALTREIDPGSTSV